MLNVQPSEPHFNTVETEPNLSHVLKNDTAKDGGTLVVDIETPHPAANKMITMDNGTIVCPEMFSSFTNVYYFTTIVTTAIGYGSQFTDTDNGRIFLIVFALVAIPYTQFMISRLTLALQMLAEKLSYYMYEKSISHLGIRETFILVGIFGYFTVMIVLVIPVIFIFKTAEGWEPLTGQ